MVFVCLFFIFVKDVLKENFLAFIYYKLHPPNQIEKDIKIFAKGD